MITQNNETIKREFYNIIETATTRSHYYSWHGHRKGLIVGLLKLRDLKKEPM